MRLARGMTQADLAGTDFTKAFISHLETGRTRASMRAAAVLAERLGVRVSDLWRDSSEGSAAEVELQLLTAERELALGAHGRALRLVDEALRSAKGLQRARLLRLRGRCLVGEGQIEEGARVLRDALRALSHLGDVEGRVRASFDLAEAHARLDEPGEALSLLLDCQRSLTTGEFVDRTLELQTHSLLAAVYWRLGQFSSADRQAEQAAELAEDVTDTRALDTLYATLMATRREQGDLEGALVWARRALALHESEGRESQIVHTWGNLAWIYIEREQFDRAEAALVKAERLAATRAGATPGNLRLTRSQLELARNHPAAARELVRGLLADAATPRTVRAQALFIDARACGQMNQPLPQIRRAFATALSAYADEPAAKRARVHEAYSKVLAARGLHKEAFAQAELALSLDRPTLPTALRQKRAGRPSDLSGPKRSRSLATHA